MEKKIIVCDDIPTKNRMPLKVLLLFNSFKLPIQAYKIRPKRIQQRVSHFNFQVFFSLIIKFIYMPINIHINLK